jgi:GNAT superfamily N-acetyltransferase
VANALEIHSLNQERLDEVCEFLVAQNWKTRAQDLRDDWTWPVRIGVLGNEVIAFLAGAFNEPFPEEWRTSDQGGNQAWIFDLLIKQGFQRRGYGAEMVRSFCTEAKIHGCTYIGLIVDRREPTAARYSFFAIIGFKQLDCES